jgi:DNA mismatch endonuclease, patch repair protein
MPVVRSFYAEIMDRYSKKTRSYVMSKIGGRDTLPEVLLRRTLWARDLRGYRLHCHLPGRPDIVYKRARLAVFVDGCFWHGCPKCRIPQPVSRVEYWKPKLRNNKRRDSRVNQELHSQKWKVLRFWEHEVLRDREKCTMRISSVVTRTRLSDRSIGKKNRKRG